MKKGINAWCFPADMALEDVFSLASSCRYDGIELNMAEGAPDGTAQTALTLGMPRLGLDAVKNLSDKYGLPVSSLSTGLHWKYPLTDNDAAKREKGARVVGEMLDAAAYIGCDAVLVVPGAVTESVSYKTAYERSLGAFRELSSDAERAKVYIGVENVWNKFLLSPLEMASFIDAAGGGYIGAYFDAGNVIQYSFPEHWAEALGHRIVKVHIKDFDSGIGNMSGFKPLLQGSMKWDRLMAALRAAGYDSYLTAELSPYPSNPTQLIRDTSDAMDYILSL